MSNTDCAGSGLYGLERIARSGVALIDGVARLYGDLFRLGIEQNPLWQQATSALGRSSCDIPPPCWVPRALGEVCTPVCAGGTATLSVCIENCQPRPSRARVSVSGCDWAIEIDEPAGIELAPMERRCIRVRARAPQGASDCGRHDCLVWVHGCNAHYLRWRLQVSELGQSACHEVEVADCPDPVHHWYDHFYCERRCTDTLRVPGAALNVSPTQDLIDGREQIRADPKATG